MARLAGLLFFIMCAFTHMELGYHALLELDRPEGEPAQVGTWMDQWHGIIIHNVQALAGLSFLVLAKYFLNIRIMDKEMYARAVDERIAELKKGMPAG